MKLSGLLIAALALGATPPGPSAVDAAAIRGYITRIMTGYVAHHDAADWRRVFTPGTAALVRVNDRLNIGQESEAVGADPICGCQDWSTIRVRAIRLTPRPDGRVTAVVRIDNFGPATRTFVMARTPGGWRVDDVLESGRFSLRATLRADNARLGRRQ